MTLREIAKALNLSPTTVSLALSGEDGKHHLSPKTVARVREFAQQAGYVPNRLAIKLFSKKEDQTVGVLFLQGAADDRTLPLLNKVMQYLTVNHCEFQVHSCQDFYANPRAYANTLRYMRSVGLRIIVIIGPLNLKYSIDPMLYEGLKVYAMDFDENGIGTPSVFQSVGLCNRKEFHVWLVRTLLERGQGPLLIDKSVRNCLDDWKEEYGVVLEEPRSADEDLFSCGKELAELAFELLHKGRCRTILSHNDRIATGMMAGLLEHKVRIPEEIQIIGYNNSAYADFTAVPLTSIRTPAEHHTFQALEHLVKGTPLPHVLYSPLELVQRQSSYPLT